MSSLITHALELAKELRARMFSFERIPKDIEAGLYTASVKGILLYHIHCAKSLVSYGDLASATSSMPNGGQLAQALQRIAEDDHLAKRPLSTAIVVSNETHMPGDGFFRQCLALGYQVGSSPEERLLFWRNELKKLDVVPVIGAVSSYLIGELETQTEQDVLKDGEVGILSGLWTDGAARLTSPPGREEDKILAPHTPGKIIPMMSSEEQRARVAAQSPFTYIPAQHLKEGDVILAENNDAHGVKFGGIQFKNDITVKSVDIQTLFRNGSPTRRVTWKDTKGRRYTTDELIHFRVVRKTPPSETASSLPNGEHPPKKRKPRRRS